MERKLMSERPAGPGRAVRLAARFACALALASPLAAAAYLLPAEAIFSTMARRRGDLGFTSLVAEGTHVKQGGVPVPVWEGILPGRGHRVERRGAAGTEISFAAGGRRWSFKQGERPGPAAKARPDLVGTFLAVPDKEGGTSRGMALLRAYGIDESVVTLGRLDQRVAYVIGAAPWETDKPQLWVDKELFVPVRLIEVDRTAGSTTDTRLLGYHSPLTRGYFPERVEVWKDGALVESTTYKSARLNEELGEDLFKTPS